MKVDQVVRYEATLLSEMRSSGKDILDSIRNDRQIKPETEAKLTELLTAFNKRFAA